MSIISSYFKRDHYLCRTLYNSRLKDSREGGQGENKGERTFYREEEIEKEEEEEERKRRGESRKGTGEYKCMT